MSLIGYLVVFGALALWAASDAKKRIAAGVPKREVGGGPVSIFIVVLIMPLIGGIFYLYKRQKDYGHQPSRHGP